MTTPSGAAREASADIGSREASADIGSWEVSADLVVVGGGVAGLSAALSASRRGLRVLTIAKDGPPGTATQYAQGGIAVPGSGGQAAIDSHVRDTCGAGGGLCDVEAVRSIVASGRDALATLQEWGAVFDFGADGLPTRTREGGHSVRRIVHAGGDATGAEVQRALTVSSRQADGHVVMAGRVVEVLTASRHVVGALVLSDRGYGVVHAPAVLLATGGLGQLFSCSTNPAGATADGIALGLDAGADTADLEFVQFHPTVLFAAGSTGRRPLVSEAVRGEGAVLVDQDGVRFMAGSHPMADLAPRDVVSRAIAERLRATGTDHVLLDARMIGDFRTRFPTVTASCLAAGIDPAHDLVPVAPAAHYSCGGLVTDVWGRTSVTGLYAAGEVARTGLHGANRLASNSLLEGLVVGERVGQAAVERLGSPTPEVDVSVPTVAAVSRERLQKTMTECAGVVRDEGGLRVAAEVLRESTTRDVVDGTALEDSALTAAASALVLAASQRAESRGCHTRADHPEVRDDLLGSFRISRNEEGVLESTFEACLSHVTTGVS